MLMYALKLTHVGLYITTASVEKCWFRKWRTLCDYFVMLIKIKNTVILLACTAGDRFKRSWYQTLSKVHCVVHSANIVKAQRWLHIAIDIVKRWNGPPPLSKSVTAYLGANSELAFVCWNTAGFNVCVFDISAHIELELCRHLNDSTIILVHGQVTIIFVVSVCLSVCLFVCAEFFSAVFDPISIKLGHMLYVWV